MVNTVFSEFEVKQVGFRIGDAAKATLVGCIGSMEESITIKKVTKSCRGVVRKTIVRETGTGTITLSLHMPYKEYQQLMGRDVTGLKEGIYASGEDGRHPTCCLTALVEDEDGNVKYKAYPKAIVDEDSTRSVENGAEEVAESEISLSFMPDDAGRGMYEARADELDEETAAAWMETFNAELAAAESTNTESAASAEG